jgi:EmrB/QacA subfamily drug resistance transporter
MEVQPDNRRWLILGICCMSLLIVGIDVTIVNVALPAIQKGLHASLGGLQWTLDAYSLVLASLLMLSGSMGDRFGRKRVFQTGLVVFTLGSLLCSLAPNLDLLVAFRCLQALGGSMLNPIALSIVTNTFTDRQERARAVGIWGAVFGVSLALGPVIGGILVTDLTWRAIFLINVPVGILAIVLTQMYVPESKAATARRIDPWGQLLTIAMLATLTFGVIEGPTDGWGSVTIVGCFAAAAIACASLITVERRRFQPLLEVRFFRSAPFSGASVIAVLAFAGMGGFLFLNTLYLQDTRGYSALHAGVLTLPLAAMICIFAPISGRLVGSRGPRLPLLVSGPFILAGGLLMLQLGDHTSTLYLLTDYVVFGIGIGLVNAPISNTAISGMPINQAGVAASVASASRQVGSSLGVAVTGSLVASASYAHLGAASHPAWAVLAGCGFGIFVLGYISTGQWARRTAETVRASLEGDQLLPGEAAPAREESVDAATSPGS